MKNIKPDVAEALVKQTEFLEKNNVIAYVGCMIDDQGRCQAAVVGNGSGVATSIHALLCQLNELDPDAAHKVVETFMFDQIMEKLSGGKDEVNKKG